MAAQLLFYDSVVPVSRDRHKDLCIKTGGDFGFARNVSSVPLTAVEMRRAAAEYVVVLAGQAESIVPAVILGVEPEQNLFVGADGGWDASYIPAFVRRYPFVFASEKDASTYTLCIDESFAGCNREGRGERLFDEDGERTRYLESVLEFVKNYQVSHRRTLTFCKRLYDLGLVEPMSAQFQLPDGTRRGLGGFMAVNRTKLKSLPRDTLADLAASDELELVHLHLHSLQHFDRLLRRIGARAAGHAIAEGDAPVAEGDGEAPPVAH